MDAAAELGRNPEVSKHQIQPEYGDEQADAGRNCRTRLAIRPNSQARIMRTVMYSCSPFQLTVQDWQPYPVDPCFCCMCYHSTCFVINRAKHIFTVCVV